MVPQEEHKGAGHRKRLRDRFLISGLDGFLDYEIVELLLTMGTPRKDCKTMAKDLIKKYGNLLRVLNATPTNLEKIKGIGPSNSFGIGLFRAMSERYYKEILKEKTSFDNKNVVYNYLINKIGKQEKEVFVMLCLDTRNNLIIDEVSVGVLNASLVHPREVFKKAISAGAAKIIVAHNHPSGDATPSTDDIETAKRVSEAGKIIGIPVVDQIVVSGSGCKSIVF